MSASLRLEDMRTRNNQLKCQQFQKKCRAKEQSRNPISLVYFIYIQNGLDQRSCNPFCQRKQNKFTETFQKGTNQLVICWISQKSCVCRNVVLLSQRHIYLHKNLRKRSVCSVVLHQFVLLSKRTDEVNKVSRILKPS